MTSSGPPNKRLRQTQLSFAPPSTVRREAPCTVKQHQPSDTVDACIGSQFDVLRVHGDGRCLFRCVATATSKELQLARRTLVGCPVDKGLASTEKRVADEMRKDVASLLRENVLAVEELSHDLQFILDDEIGKSFQTIEDRIDCISHESSYVGYLEIMAVAYILRKQFRIFTENPKSEAYTLHSLLPTAPGESSPICLLYRLDTNSEPGHYDLLLPKAAVEQQVDLDLSLTNESSTLYTLPFVQFLKSVFTATECEAAIDDGQVRKDTVDAKLQTQTYNQELLDAESFTQSKVTRPTEPSQTPTVSEYPSIWTPTQAKEFSSDHPWIMFSNGYLGCSSCKKVTNYGAFIKQGMKISKPWTDCLVTFNGKQRQSQLSSLRKKIYEHESGQQHKTAEQILNKAKDSAMEAVVAEQQKHLYDSTTRIFRSVYTIMKSGRPFSDLPSLIDLQSINGLDMGVTLHSRYSAAEISDLIVSQMRAKLCEEIIRSRSKIALIIDESTTISSKSVLILYLRANVCQRVSSFFLDLVELDGSSADAILDAVLKTLSKHGFTDDYRSSHLIGVCADGASVMVGRKSGVLTALCAKYPRIIRWHCLCHRIELSVGDTLEDVGGINHFKSLMDKLYSLYSQSPKNQRELANCAAELDIQLTKIGRVLSVRWVALSYRAVSAVHRNYSALYAHFTSAAVDYSRDSSQRRMYRGLADSLASEQFILNLGLMMDALEELTNVSEALQRDDVTLVRAYQVINRTIRALSQMKTESREHVEEAVNGVERQLYRNVSVIRAGGSGRKQAAVDRMQFLHSLVDNLSSRLFTTIAANKHGNLEYNKSEFDDLTAQVQVLNMHAWPADVTTPWSYGEAQLRRLCERLAVDFSKARTGFRDFIDSGGLHKPDDLAELQDAVETIPVTSADAERGFSTMNIIASPIRNRLSVERLSNLMFATLIGPPLESFNALPYVKKWLASAHRGAYDNQTRKRQPKEDLRYSHIHKIFA